MNQIISELHNSLHQGFIDKDELKGSKFKPALVTNNPSNNNYVLTTIKEELEICESFFFAVAFITEGGLAMLKSKLLDLKQRGIEGRILTSYYLNFNKPKIFKELMKLENVEIRITEAKGFHSKGYIFEQTTHFTLVVGSSNLTQGALKANTEWNIKLSSLENGEIVHHFKEQFDELWCRGFQLNNEWILWYEEQYISPLNNIVNIPTNSTQNNFKNSLSIEPNKMQEAALIGIQNTRNKGSDKGLIISATGTGKTYLAAFDVRSSRPKRLLFIVHREQILLKAMSDFQKVLGGNSNDYGILSGSSKQVDARYLFATQQSIQKYDNLLNFKKDYFDYILIDEAHRAGSPSYQKIINYFNPKFLLGMTATPERTDNYNLYELFNYNIAYEIRLQEALEDEMLCPFHYFGVSDITVNGLLIDENSNFSHLLNEERINHLIEKISYYGYSGEKVCGLIFCGKKDEAKSLSVLLNERGFNTVALTGDDNQNFRTETVQQLEDGELDYILTVDIFNEGIDIPKINKVIMLRNTESSIIFIQQLGRGLRKHPSKSYVTIIDFIGNYKNNYLVPVALSGDFSQNKDNLRRRVKDTTFLKGISTIDFEEVAKQQIFNSITNNNLSTAKILKDAYTSLKYKIGKIPSLQDFYLNQSVDPITLLESYGNYYIFLKKMNDETEEIPETAIKSLTFFSQEFLSGKRLHEILLLEYLLSNDEISISKLENLYFKNSLPFNIKYLKSIEKIFNLDFYGQVARKKYGNEPVIIYKNDKFSKSNHLTSYLENNMLYKFLINDVIETTKLRSMRYNHEAQITIGEKYSRKDACRLLNWEADESSTVYGYKTKYNTSIIFVTLHKKDNVESSIAYGDEFLSEQIFKWFSRSKRTLESKEVLEIINSKENNNEIHFFIKKDDGEGTDFYYLGEVEVVKNSAKNSKMKDKNGSDIPVVTMEFLFRQTVEHNLYQYLITN